MARILIVDDDEDLLTLVGALLGIAGHVTESLTSAEGALETIRRFRPDLILLDILIPGMSGGLLYRAIRAQFGSQIPVLVCSATSMRIKCESDSLLAHCPKPVEPNRLLAAIDNLLKLAAAP